MSLSSPIIVLVNLIVMVAFLNCVCSRVIEESKEDLLLKELSGTHLLMAAHPVIYRLFFTIIVYD